MKRNFAITAALATMLVAALMVTPGCSKPSPDTIKKALRLAGKEGSRFGLKKWAEEKPEAARETATTLKKNIDEVLLPYLNGGQLPSSAEVQAFIQSSLFKDVDQKVKDAIILASVALDAALPIPGADTYLKAEHVEYLKEFMTGISEGCAEFLSRGAVGPRTNWIK